MLTRSFIDSANDPAGDFPLNNLALGTFDLRGPHAGIAIGDMVLDAGRAEAAGLIAIPGGPVCGEGVWNPLMERGPAAWTEFRRQVTALLAEGSPHRDRVAPFLHPRAGLTLRLPFRIAEYTDFYSGRHHAFNVGSMFRDPENALPPNWLHIPIGYNGRASSVVVSGTPVRRPWGQLKGAGHDTPIFAPSRRFDFELELGAIVGQPSDRRISVAEAEAMIFGYVLLNDWSARDIQAWEYQPLGPFQAKATATSLGPWIVMADALRPFRVPTPEREVPLLPYLAEPGPLNHDIALEIALAPEGQAETVVSRTNARELYYSAPQQLAHHTSSGCPMRVGDLLGSGTISGPTTDSRGSMLELSWGGKEPVAVAGGTRTFLEDGDRVIFRGQAQGPGYRIGFGDCEGVIAPAA